MARRTPIWKSIADTLTRDISAERYRPGDKLPTEAALAARFGVNRHTVRHALAALSKQGMVYSRRGSGVFVTTTPTDYPIGRRVRFHRNLAAAGRLPEKQVLHLETRIADQEERNALQLATGDKVHIYDGLSLSDGVPIALFQSVFPAGRFAGLPAALMQTRSVTRALALQGVADYTRAWTRMSAVAATATQALHLRIREGDPILRSLSLNIDTQGQSVEFGHTYFVGDRVTLSVTPD